MARTTFTTAAGLELELSKGVFRDYLYCGGCGRGWNIPTRDSDRTANHHANSCRRTGTRR